MEMPRRTKVRTKTFSECALIGVSPRIIPGIQTSENAKFYARSASFESFSNEGKTLVIQFTVKHEQKIDCGGGYVKVSGGLLSPFSLSLSLSPSYVYIYLSLSITLSLSLLATYLSTYFPFYLFDDSLFVSIYLSVSLISSSLILSLSWENL